MADIDWKSRVDPELRPLLKQLPNLTFGPVIRWLVRFFQHLTPTPPLPEEVERRTETVGEQKVDIYSHREVETASGALLWIHGGGRIIGLPRFGAYPCARIAKAHQVVVAATSYRKAPAHPFPAALDDCLASWHWLVENADRLGFSRERIVIGGDSAGGGLAAELAQRLHDEGELQPAGQLLVYPMLDDRTALRDELTAQKHLIWNNTSNQYAWSCYLGKPPGADELPPYAAAARREDLCGLPPAWMTVGTLDLFLDEDRAYAERLRAAGVPVELHVVEDAFHGYFGLGRDEAPIAEMWSSLDDFLSGCFETGHD